MSDDEHDEDIDIDSDMDDENGECGEFSYQVAEKRKHHNALERKRRDHIKESFSSLRDSVPSLQGEKSKASRAQILKQATDYIQYMSKKTLLIQNDIDNVIQENRDLEKQVMSLEKARVTSNYINEHNSYTNGSGNATSTTSSASAAAASSNDVDVESINETPVVFGANVLASSSSSSAKTAGSSSKPFSTNPKSLLAKPRQGYIAPTVNIRKRSKLS